MPPRLFATFHSRPLEQREFWAIPSGAIVSYCQPEWPDIHQIFPANVQDWRDGARADSGCRGLLVLLRWYYLRQGYLWAFAYIFLRGSAFAIHKSITRDSVRRCDDVVRGIRGAWGRRRASAALAVMRQLGAGSKRRRMVRGLLIL